MSFTGQSPRVKRTRFSPQAADPTNPAEGDLFYSDGTPRAAGLWIYNGSDWTQLAQDELVYAVTNITSASSPYTVLSSDQAILANAALGAITVNLPAAASSLGRVLMIKKTDSSTNAVTLDGNSSETIDGSTTFAMNRQYDSIQIVSNGSNWLSIALSIPDDGFQSQTLTGSGTFTVPANVYWLDVLGAGGGGGGAAGGGSGGSPNTCGGGGGGQGAQPFLARIPTTPGASISYSVGAGGARGTGTTSTNGANGSAGGNTTFGTLTFEGGAGGDGNTGATGGSSTNSTWTPRRQSVGGGGGGDVSTGGSANSGAAGADSLYASGGAPGGTTSGTDRGASGGGGGAGYGDGGDGGDAGASSAGGDASAAGQSAGGGGGGGADDTGRGGHGSAGGIGLLMVFWNDARN